MGKPSQNFCEGFFVFKPKIRIFFEIQIIESEKPLFTFFAKNRVKPPLFKTSFSRICKNLKFFSIKKGNLFKKRLPRQGLLSMDKTI